MVQDPVPSIPLPKVTRVGFDPSAPVTSMSKASNSLFARLEAKAIYLPTGDQAGQVFSSPRIRAVPTASTKASAPAEIGSRSVPASRIFIASSWGPGASRTHARARQQAHWSQSGKSLSDVARAGQWRCFRMDLNIRYFCKPQASQEKTVK